MAVRADPAPDDSQVAEGISHYDARRYAEALAVLAPLADAGSAAAQYHLGLMYARGDGVAQDLARAALWIRRAAEQGHAHSQYLAGHMYARGDGVERDLAQAHMWFSLATRSGWWKAREAREKLVDAGMTPAQITEAGRLLRAWEARHERPQSRPPQRQPP